MKAERDRVDNLVEYVQGLMNKENGKKLYLKHKSDIEQVTPQEVFEIFHFLLEQGKKPKELLVFIDKVINVFYKSLANYSWEWPEKNSFMDFLMQENHALIEKLEGIKEIIKDKSRKDRKKELIPRIYELQEFNQHYLKKENILFPFLEKKMKKFDGLAIMWALHDEARAELKKVIECLEGEACSEAELNTELGKLFFAMYGLAQKEELILFPAASEIITENEWVEMQRQSLEYEFPFIEKPGLVMKEKNISAGINGLVSDFKEGHFETETGTLDFEQMLAIFNALPVDLTFVDENNKVKFFTKPKDRIFPRSPAIIGRDVEKCHPPESVHVVIKILDAFKAGTQDNAVFWIKVKGRMVLIQYFALRSSKGKYLGTLEVSQDITEVVKLEGERRLLQFE
jgi:DUF438 domain-containing protein